MAEERRPIVLFWADPRASRDKLTRSTAPTRLHRDHVYASLSPFRAVRIVLNAHADVLFDDRSCVRVKMTSVARRLRMIYSM